MIFDFIFVYFLLPLNEAIGLWRPERAQRIWEHIKGHCPSGMCSSAMQEILGLMFEAWLRFPNSC